MNETYEFISNVYNTSTTVWNISYINDSNEEKEAPPREYIPLPVAVIFIIVGILGNSLVCLAICLDRKLQNLTNYFLLSLAVNDLIANLLILPGKLFILRYELEPSNFYLCFLQVIGADFMSKASAIHICFISISRYLAIRNPFDRASLTKKRVAINIGLVWTISFITIIPFIVSAIVTNHPNKRLYCFTLLNTLIYAEKILFEEAFVIIIVAMAFVVSLILSTIKLQELAKKRKENAAKRRSGLVRNFGGKISQKQQQPETKALRVIWLMSFVVIINHLMYTSIVFFYFIFHVIPRIIIYLKAYAGYLTFVLNPIIYTIFNKTFRNNFKSLILFRYKIDNKKPEKLDLTDL